jgi:hypothetical protein
MGARFVDQGDFGLAAAAKLVAKPGGKLEPASAAADDNDAMRMGFVIRRGAASHCIGHRSLLLPCRSAHETRLLIIEDPARNKVLHRHSIARPKRSEYDGFRISG